MLDIIFKCKMHFHTPDHHSHDACLGINVYVMFTLVKNWFIQGFVIHSSFTASFLFVEKLSFSLSMSVPQNKMKKMRNAKRMDYVEME